jgi:hypothetical protein
MMQYGMLNSNQKKNLRKQYIKKHSKFKLGEEVIYLYPEGILTISEISINLFGDIEYTCSSNTKDYPDIEECKLTKVNKMTKKDYLNKMSALSSTQKEIQYTELSIKNAYIKANAKFKEGDKFLHPITGQQVHIVKYIRVSSKGVIFYEDETTSVSQEEIIPIQRYCPKDGFSGSLTVLNLIARNKYRSEKYHYNKALLKFTEDGKIVFIGDHNEVCVYTGKVSFELPLYTNPDGLINIEREYNE